MGKGHKDNHRARVKREGSFGVKAVRKEHERRLERAKCSVCGSFHGKGNTCTQGIYA